MKQKRRRRFSVPWLLLGSILLGAAAGVIYFVPIPGFTFAAPPPPVDTTKPSDAPVKDPLEERTAQLARAEVELKSREESVKNQETQIATLLKDLMGQQSESDAIRKAANLYSAMPPYKAAPLMEALDPEIAVQILRRLDEDLAGAIVAYMDPQKGSVLMRELARPAAMPSTAKP